ncbi:hypothetical protein [Mycolicibacterium sp. P9-22]|uniref:hypothetical protein n=1 Tax=Mycolicibacterium sp. P9-22 TaxID=2024613 RepID=UPI0011EBDCF0|nr:hypothetical protein [Mycolicibacterium sp. P9-22]
MSDHEEAFTTDTEPEEVGSDDPVLEPGRSMRSALILGMVALTAVGGVVGWLGYSAHRINHVAEHRGALLAAARQAAVNLTTIDFTNADAEVAHIADSATGDFRDDFQKRAPAFVDVVKQAQSKSEGTVTAAGVESYDGAQAKVLIAVTVKTTTAADQNPPPRGWRMRIGVKQTDAGPKIDTVEFVP